MDRASRDRVGRYGPQMRCAGDQDGGPRQSEHVPAKGGDDIEEVELCRSWRSLTGSKCFAGTINHDSIFYKEDLLRGARDAGSGGHGVLSFPGFWRSCAAGDGTTGGCRYTGEYPE